ncbi:hypothetical protein PHYPSEUDO_002590 [Phytophthora pseudosyringae]|uniref:CDR ABC transporter domain-containing protein n=1 Tax=Phytophthora pseudosyringae TaxID=221518 RepID=A0A8T1V1P8_9STRA|nr:hypothetical protein PHYPSEUDO_002590 [Phytophthora pseudosyringae]
MLLNSSGAGCSNAVIYALCSSWRCHAVYTQCRTRYRIRLPLHPPTARTSCRIPYRSWDLESNPTYNQQHHVERGTYSSREANAGTATDVRKRSTALQNTPLFIGRTTVKGYIEDVEHAVWSNFGCVFIFLVVFRVLSLLALRNGSVLGRQWNNT